MDENNSEILHNKKSFLFKVKELCKRKLNDHERNFFLITSPGQMGTFWLASQLNKHTQIFCSHSYDKPAWGASGSPLRGTDGERQRKIFKQYFDKLTLENFFNENAEVTDKPFIGNVHAFSVDRALTLLKKEKLKNIKIINLIRHPISRINSLVKCMKNEWYDYGYFDHLTFIFKIYQEHGRRLVSECFNNHHLPEFDDSIERQFFVVALILERGTAYQVQTAEKNNISNIKYEDITTSKQAMEKLVRYLGNDALIDNYNWLNQDISYKKINSHTNSTYNTIQSIFNTWDPWKKELYRYVVAEEIFNLYTNNYYDCLLY